MSANKRKNKIKYIIASIILLIALFASAAITKLRAYNLPDIGSPVELMLSYHDEKLLGEYIYKDLVKQIPVIQNPFLEDYIQTLGNKLLAHSNSRYEKFTFFIIDSPIINAFAMPGGYIGVNKGLITAADSEDEIASVLAHEISHVTQRHIARSFEKQQQVQIPMIAGILTGALLAAVNPELGQTIIAGSMAAGNQSLINYTRSNEAEADRIGMQLLAKSDYPPQSMADFFSKLQKLSYADSDFYPEYLRTHPINENRIADARNRADMMTLNKKKSTNFDFDLVKSILKINHDPNYLKIIDNNITASKKSHLKTQQRDLYKFNAAYAMIKNHDYKKATKLLTEIKQDYPDNNIIVSLLAVTYETDANKALSIIEKQLEYHENNIPLSIQYAETAMLLNKHDEAINTLKKITKAHTDYNPKIDLLLAKNYDKTGKKWHANLAYAEYSIKNGDLQAALMQLKASKKYDKLTAYQSKILNFKINDLEEKYKTRKEKLKEWM